MSGIFISYRRSTSQHLARSIFMALKQHGHDVFLDVNSIDSGAFDRIIKNQIAARPHFLLLLSTGALERCQNEDDWLRKEIEEAFRLNRNIVPVFDEGFDINREKGYLPEPIRSELPLKNAPPYSHYYFDAFIQTLSDRFFKEVVDNVPVSPTPPAERAEVQKRIERAAQIETTDTPQVEIEVSDFMQKAAAFEKSLEPNLPKLPLIWGVENIIPPPFDWVYIPPGTVTLEMNLDAPQVFSVSAFNIAKYPITNAQFEVFIQAEDGYRNPLWWDAAASTRQWRSQNPTPQPRAFPQDDHPRANVTYYEALAFCNWLAHRFNAPAPNLPPVTITLPTQHQWHKAAYAESDNRFPWGNNLDTEFFNSDDSGIGRTTPVTKYPNGASPYGVMDMAGNVSEWCLGKDENQIPVRGGAWALKPIANMFSRMFFEAAPVHKNYIGFRIVMMNTP